MKIIGVFFLLEVGLCHCGQPELAPHRRRALITLTLEARRAKLQLELFATAERLLVEQILSKASSNSAKVGDVVADLFD